MEKKIGKLMSDKSRELQLRVQVKTKTNHRDIDLSKNNYFL